MRIEYSLYTVTQIYVYNIFSSEIVICIKYISSKVLSKLVIHTNFKRTSRLLKNYQENSSDTISSVQLVVISYIFFLWFDQPIIRLAH